ncbi:MAG: hypothetical protein OEQ39_25605 [Gammaproteobacteria bacterium]|nr:hypothetical protein [Gammaproteobacteria bacterium]
MMDSAGIRAGEEAHPPQVRVRDVNMQPACLRAAGVSLTHAVGAAGIGK